jgi:hypothetical protein
MGDYCEECIIFAQKDWDDNNVRGFVGDRYDPITEDALLKEIAGMKKLKKEREEKGHV